MAKTYIKDLTLNNTRAINEKTGKSYYIRETIYASPDCYAKVFRYSRRDTRSFKDGNPEAKLNPKSVVEGGIKYNLDEQSPETIYLSEEIVIDSDIISCNIAKTKSSPTGTFVMVLSPGTNNYHALLHPGDHILIWMRRNKNEVIDFSNSEKSGLKVYGIITDVQRVVTVLPDGKKAMAYRVSGEDFGYFFKHKVYYNDQLSSIFRESRTFAFAELFDKGNLFGLESLGPDVVLTRFISTYLGAGIDNSLTKYDHIRAGTENRMLVIPKQISDFFSSFVAPLAIKDSPNFADILCIRTGIERYSLLSPEPLNDGGSVLLSSPRLIRSRPMEGLANINIDTGNDTPLWSILATYANLVINEMFVDLKVAPSGDTLSYKEGQGVLMPTFTHRQIPFTSEEMSAAITSKSESIETTTFLNLPRIKIDEAFILSETTGRSEQERFNFIELFGSSSGVGDQASWGIQYQIALGNHVVDSSSVSRYGLKPFITTTSYPVSPNVRGLDQQIISAHLSTPLKEARDNSLLTTDKWINLLSDWWLPAHTLENGTITCVGIEEPLSIGDNLEIIREKIDNENYNELYHIEGYSHLYVVNPDGKKTFKTTLRLTRGQLANGMPIYMKKRIGTESTASVNSTIGLTQVNQNGQRIPRGRDNEFVVNDPYENKKQKTKSIKDKL